MRGDRMKHWIRKAVLGLCLAVSFGALTACSSSENTTVTIDPAQKQTLEQFGEQQMEALGAMSAEDIQKSIAQAEHDKNAILYNGLTNYLNSQDRLGAFVSVDSVEASEDEDGYSIAIVATFEQRKLDLTLGFDEDMTAYTEMTFSPEYSMSEKMTDAAGNLLLGMGSVFVILIFIAWIISLFKYVNKIGQKKSPEAAAPKKAAAPAPAAAPAAVPAAPALSGAELEAVIAAAIAAYEAENGTEDGFVPGPTLNNGLVVRSIRKR